jgi:hypothetical protein
LDDERGAGNLCAWTTTIRVASPNVSFTAMWPQRRSRWRTHSDSSKVVDPSTLGRNAKRKMAAGDTTLLLERGKLSASASPLGTRWTGVWVNDPDEWYRRLRAMHVDAAKFSPS